VSCASHIFLSYLYLELSECGLHGVVCVFWRLVKDFYTIQAVHFDPSLSNFGFRTRILLMPEAPRQPSLIPGYNHTTTITRNAPIQHGLTPLTTDPRHSNQHPPKNNPHAVPTASAKASHYSKLKATCHRRTLLSFVSEIGRHDQGLHVICMQGRHVVLSRSDLHLLKHKTWHVCSGA
jgi:hypothetical protein